MPLATKRSRRLGDRCASHIQDDVRARAVPSAEVLRARWSEASTESASSCGSETSSSSETDPLVMNPQEIAGTGGGLSGLTTAMVRNVPPRYSQAGLLAELNRAGFNGSYDFFYLPLAIRSKHNRGFAFINFFQPDQAEKFYRQYHGRFLCNFREATTDPLQIVPAELQGFEANAGAARVPRRLQNAPVLLRFPPNTHEPKDPEDSQDLVRRATSLELKDQCTADTKGQAKQDAASCQAPSARLPQWPLPVCGGAMLSELKAQRFCVFCGAELAGSGRFCHYCGTQTLRQHT